MRIFLANVACELGQVMPAESALSLIYPESECGGKTARLAQSYARRNKIKRRSTVVDLAALPERRLLRDDYHPALWARDLLRRVIPECFDGELGSLVVAYNITSHQNVLPSLAAQIVASVPSLKGAFPLEQPYLGCAGGLIAIERAAELVRRTGRPAVVYCFDQCLWILDRQLDREDPEFKAALRANSLFSDGACALLVLPEARVHHVRGPVAELLDQTSCHVSGDVIRMNRSRFIVGDGVADALPQLVADRAVKPLLERAGHLASDIPEWSFHQGGEPVLLRFGSEENLGLSAAQLAESLDAYYEYGNFSAPSCFFVWQRQASKPERAGRHGMLVAFGAGYYLSSCLYRWIS